MNSRKGSDAKRASDPAISSHRVSFDGKEL